MTTTEQIMPGSDETVGMTYWTEQDLPFYYELARTFPLADRWFSSCLGPTFPNRRGMAGYMAHVRTIDQFFADADAGKLPSFSIADPDFREYSEENPQDIRKGESFAAEVINRVMHGPGWKDTLLIWLYDEHGGYYDHVPPPAAVPPDDVLSRNPGTHRSRRWTVLTALFPGYARHAERPDAGPPRYDTCGFRVPAVIVSPYARPDCVISEVFDHTSVLKLVQEKWNLPALTRRDAAATSPLGALDLSGPPAFLTPPDLPGPALKWGSW